jgi:beta-phosphoglucomutase
MALGKAGPQAAWSAAVDGVDGVDEVDGVDRGSLPQARAAIFDLDGTLVDNMRCHAQAWAQTARRVGCERPLSFFETETAGKKSAEILAMLLGPAADPETVARLSAEKEALYRETFRAQLAPVAGARELLARLRQAGVPMAIATLAPRENRDFVLDGLALRPLFAHVIGAEQSPRGKPHPDIYLAAARALGVPAPECVAFEDAVNGVQSALGAGMDVVALTTASAASALAGAGARWVVPDYTRLPEDLERRLFGSCGGA